MRRKLNILLVDDDELNHRLVSVYIGRLLHKLGVGYNLDLVYNEDEFHGYIKKFDKRKKIDLILFDYNLGGYRFPEIMGRLESKYGKKFVDTLYVFTCYSPDEIYTGDYSYVGKDNSERLRSIILNKLDLEYA